MASISREIVIDARPEQVWDAVRDVGAPHTRLAPGFVVDTKGLIATNQQVIGTATAVEVQLTPEIKVMARVLVADSMRDVAVLWIDPTLTASIRATSSSTVSGRP